MHEVLGVNLLRTFRGDVVNFFFLAYGPMLTKTKKKNVKKKNKILHFEKKSGLDIMVGS